MPLSVERTYGRVPSLAAAALAAVLAAVLAGCSSLSVTDLMGQMLVSGRVVGRNGQPLANPSLRLFVFDAALPDAPPPFPQGNVFLGEFIGGPDGSFELRIGPTPGMIAYAERHDGRVDFKLFVEPEAPNGIGIESLDFHRQLRDGHWIDGPVTVELRSQG